jgi:hypothetical protein
MSDFDAESYTTQVNRQVSNTVSADYTLQKEDEESIVIIDSSSSIVGITIPSDASVNIPVGTVIWLYRDGANFVRLVEDTGVTLHPSEGIITEDKTETYLRKQATNEWIIGDISKFTSDITIFGGTITEIEDNNVTYKVHSFETPGTYNLDVVIGGEVEYLVVAGGGSGGDDTNNKGGGGGGGGMLEGSQSVTPGLYNITVGDGGVYPGGGSAGNNGEDSSAIGITVAGGGGGGGNTIRTGKDGGSGGGAEYYACGDTLGPPGQGISGQGNAGGGTSCSPNKGGGGGGAGSPGVRGNPPHGGSARATNIRGFTEYWAHGGGGNSDNTDGSGGPAPGFNDHGGFRGSDSSFAGGGGADGGDGGSGIVVIRYPI